jgi:hypothetical protein
MGTRLLAIGLAGFLAAGCGHAKKDPGSSRDGAATSGTGAYKKLVVFARVSDPASRSDAERAFVKRLSDKGVEGIASSTILSAADTMPNGEIDRAVRQSGSRSVEAMRKAHVLEKAEKAEPASRPRRVSPS